MRARRASKSRIPGILLAAQARAGLVLSQEFAVAGDVALLPDGFFLLLFPPEFRVDPQYFLTRDRTYGETGVLRENDRRGLGLDRAFECGYVPERRSEFNGARLDGGPGGKVI